MKKGKRYTEAAKLVDKCTQYSVADALDLAVKTASAKFDETVELHVKLGVDGRNADQQVRGVVVLPHGTGKSKKILVFAKGDNADVATKAGADFVGAEDMVTKIQSQNWFGFDVCVTTPDMMPVIGRIAKVLGPKGLMPNPKSGTVTTDLAKAIAEIKAGKVEYRLDKTAVIHCSIGKKSFGKEKLLENYNALFANTGDIALQYRILTVKNLAATIADVQDDVAELKEDVYTERKNATAGASVGNTPFYIRMGKLIIANCLLNITSSVANGDTLVSNLPQCSASGGTNAVIADASGHTIRVRIAANATTLLAENAQTNTGWYSGQLVYLTD